MSKGESLGLEMRWLGARDHAETSVGLVDGVGRHLTISEAFATIFGH